ncbi:MULTISPECIES: hypothetical protein [Microbacterium]|uniref:hypothetical protein n=1 Tax=Microbacterium TaxID=33882 RepID=UPI00217D623C|nr:MULTISPECIES: hypothetical protein [Microbacterium]UWF76803.1 hypothetical protein JSY13_08040 [Microbacterium neungamense]WCM54954.1 hypothetical protein JRG78_08040 [Microbacterium sp. EF45047]
MERTLVVAASAPVPRGNRVEIAQVREGEADAGAVAFVFDLDRGIRYRLRDIPGERVEVWRGHVRDCTVADTAAGPQTTLVVAAVDPAESADAALREADAAAAAAKAEADRWGGADRPPAEAPDRFW